MNERNVRIAVVIVDLFAGVSAVAGAIGLVAGFMQIPLSVLSGTPFANFMIPALLLGLVVGGSALAAALIALFGPRLTLLKQWRFEPLATAIAGVIMVGWMTVEIAMIGLGAWLQVAYFVVGLLMIGLAVVLQEAEWRQAERQAETKVRQHAHAV